MTRILAGMLVQGVAACGGSSTCAERTSEASTLVAAAVANAQTDTSCTNDDDCSWIDNSTDCSAACGGEVLNGVGAAAVASAVAQAGATACRDFRKDGCTVMYPPCPPPRAGGTASCLNGVCASFPPAAWISASLEVQPGADPGWSSSSLSCSAPGCTLWTVTPDGQVLVSLGGAMHAATLTSTDFATVDGILRDPTFRAIGVTIDPGCASPTGNGLADFTIARSNVTIGFEVSGCIDSGPAGNDFLQLYEVFQSY